MISNNLKILIIDFARLYKKVDKKSKSIRRNCQAVSEAIGEVLMIAVVVIAFSSIAVTIFSDVATKSPHIPHADLESTHPDDNKVRILHVGGEDINLKDMNIIINSSQFSMSDPKVTITNSYVDNSTNQVFSLGDCVEINTTGLGGSNLYLIHIPSKQILLKVKL